MKKILFSLLGLILLFTACSNDEDVITKSSQLQKEASSMHFYGVKQVNEKLTKGVAQKDKLWYNGTSIKVKFLNGSKDYQDKVKTYAAEWEQYANIKFEFVDSGEALVRIGFDWNDDRYITWSYVGTDCKYEKDQNEATMSFAYFDELTEKDRRADVLRAFGMVLGLELEHRHLDFDPGWTSRISQYWEGEIEDIPWENLKKYVFNPVESINTVQTEEYDENSIMVWPFSSRYAKYTARDFNYDLSEKDIDFIQILYPGLNKELIRMETTITDNILFSFAIDKDIIVDWGDGNKEKIEFKPPMSWNTLKHKYDNVHQYTITLLGHEDAVHSFGVINEKTNIKEIYFENCTGINDLTLSELSYSIEKVEFNKKNKLKVVSIGFNIVKELDFSNCPEITRLNTGGYNLAKLVIAANHKLEELNISSSPLLEHLDISKNTELEFLNIQNCKSLLQFDISKNTKLKNILLARTTELKGLDISNCTQLTTLAIIDIPEFKEIDLSHCPVIESLRLERLGLTSLDISNNKKIEHLDIEHTPISNLLHSEKTIFREVTLVNIPFVKNQSIMAKLGESLPHVYDHVYDSNIAVSKDELPFVKSFIGEICKEKGWKIINHSIWVNGIIIYS